MKDSKRHQLEKIFQLCHNIGRRELYQPLSVDQVFALLHFPIGSELKRAIKNSVFIIIPVLELQHKKLANRTLFSILNIFCNQNFLLYKIVEYTVVSV